MPINNKANQKWTLNSIALQDAYTDFILSRQAALRSENTILFYQFTVGLFVKWIEGKDITSPAEIHARHVREYLAELATKGKSDTTIADHAKGIRVLVRFWYAENYLPSPVIFDIPKVAKKRLPTLNAEKLERVLSYCDTFEKALVMLMVDSGLRRAEVCELCWSDVDIKSGVVVVLRGKGGSARVTRIGARARRALLKYRRTIKTPITIQSPVFQARGGERFTGSGLRKVFVRITEKSGVKVTAHSLRRTFAILSLRAGMSPLHLQGLGGWEDMTMVEHYAQMEDEDFIQAHQEHSPIDNL